MFSFAIRGIRTLERLSAGRVATALLDTLLAWQARANQRHQLSMMSDADLKDIGLTRVDVEWEISKPFWIR